jgi:phosphate transport system substrate-binding protein
VKQVLAVALCAAALCGTQAHAEDASVPSYQARPVAIPKDASYVRSDGSIMIVGDDATEAMMTKLNALFVKTHPGFRFTLVLKGSSTGIGGLTAGVSAMAPMGRAGWPSDISAFKEAYGYLPTDIRIGYDAYTRDKHKSPPALYVNVKNPLAGLTVAQAERIFTTGGSTGDITHWSQLGMKGEWEKREIHLYGPRDDGALATTLRETMMGKLPFSSRYEPFDHLEDIIKAVAHDPYGIGLVGFFDANAIPEVKLVPLAASEKQPFAAPSYENMKAGRYPYASYLRMYVNRRPGAPLDPFVKEYLRMVLSREGEAIIEAEKENEQGFVPLEPAAVAAELTKLQ